MRSLLRARRTKRRRSRIASAARFSTYYFISGLRGAADVSGDGRVTLNEAYNFAFNETLAGTERTAGGAQHPAYEIQLSGTGDVVMTDLREPSARLQLPRELHGRLHVRARDGVLLAELTKHAGAEIILALEPGSYHLTVESEGAYRQTQVTLSAGQTTPLVTSALVLLAGEPTRLRGGAGPSSGVPDANRGEPDQEGEPVWVPVNVALIPNLSINRLYGPRVQNAFSFNVLVGRAMRLRGLELGLLASLRTEDAVGLQLSGLANAAGGTLLGGQFSSRGQRGRSSGARHPVRRRCQHRPRQRRRHPDRHRAEPGRRGELGLPSVRASIWCAAASTASQLAGLGAVVGGEMTGMQLSMGVSSSGQVQGVQIAFINIGGEEPLVAT